MVQMARRLKQLILVLALASLFACTQQAYKTHTVIENSESSYDDIALSLEDLKLVVADGATHEKFRAIKALRHLSKYNENPGKREIALRTLVFTYAYADDGDVQDAAESRIKSILYNKKSPHLKIAIIKALADMVTGDLGYEDESSVFTGSKKYFDDREDVAEFLLEQFDQVELSMQLQLVKAVEQILSYNGICEKQEMEECDNDFASDYKELTYDVVEELIDFLTDTGIDQRIKTEIISSLVNAQLSLQASGQKPGWIQKTQKEYSAWKESILRLPNKGLQLLTGQEDKIDLIESFLAIALSRVEEKVESYDFEKKEALLLDTSSPETIVASMKKMDAYLFVKGISLEKREIEAKPFLCGKALFKHDSNDIAQYRVLYPKSSEKKLPTQWLSLLQDTADNHSKDVLQKYIYNRVMYSLQNGYAFSGNDSVKNLIKLVHLEAFTSNSLTSAEVSAEITNGANIQESTQDIIPTQNDTSSDMSTDSTADSKFDSSNDAQVIADVSNDATRSESQPVNNTAEKPSINTGTKKQAFASIVNIEDQLSLIAASISSLVDSGQDISPLLRELGAGIDKTEDLYTKRLYFFALVEALPFQNELAESEICSRLGSQDLLTRHLVEEKYKQKFVAEKSVKPEVVDQTSDIPAAVKTDQTSDIAQVVKAPVLNFDEAMDKAGSFFSKFRSGKD
jgi:hypothetical protein